jgi:tRNA (guanine9-N1)-methyltransferase
VFSILVEYITRQSWSEAFEAVIPQRKFETASRRERRGKSNWTNPATSNPGEIKDKGEDEDQDDEDEGMSEVEEATFDWSRTDGGNKADEEDEEAAMNV